MIDDDGYQALRDAIVSGDLLPSERLVEEDLSPPAGPGRAARSAWRSSASSTTASSSASATAARACGA